MTIISTINIMSLSAIILFGLYNLNRMSLKTSHFMRTAEILLATVAFYQLAGYLCYASFNIMCGAFSDENMALVNVSIILYRLCDRRNTLIGRPSFHKSQHPV
jgi:hypothetical protein